MLKIVKVKGKVEGNLKAHDILREVVDSQTLLALSGGTSPDYTRLLATTEGTESRSDDTERKIKNIVVGAVCLVDERYGEPFHDNSNELLLKNSGVVDYLDLKNIDFYKILEGRGIDQTVEDYDQLMSELFVKFPKKVGVMGIGTDLHTAGIFPNSLATHSPSLVVSQTVDDKFPQRITMTLKALGEFTNFIILAFGEEKRDALVKMLDEKENDMQKYPEIFYRKNKAKSWLVTDVNL